MKDKKVERALMSPEEFKDYLTQDNIILALQDYIPVGKFKSVRRAIKRGNCTKEGYIVPRRPFNERGNTSERAGKHSRVANELKRAIYGNIRRAFYKSE